MMTRAEAEPAGVGKPSEEINVNPSQGNESTKYVMKGASAFPASPSYESPNTKSKTNLPTTVARSNSAHSESNSIYYDAELHAPNSTDEAVALMVEDQLEHLRAELQSQGEILKEQKATITTLQKNTNPRRTSFVGSTFRQSLIVRGTPEDAEGKLPDDTYAFFVVSKVMSQPFFYALSVFFIQMITLTLLIMDQVPLNNRDGELFLEIPPNVETIVRVTQFFCILIAVLTQEDLREALVLLNQGYNHENMQIAFEDSSEWKWWLFCVLRLLEGVTGLMVTFVLIVVVDNVLDLLLNFTAMEFVSQLDNVAFFLASVGYFGSSIMEKSYIVNETTFRIPGGARGKRNHLYHRFLLFAVLCVMYGLWGNIVHLQRSNEYLCKQIFVQLGDDELPTLGTFSGMYKLEKGARRNDDRVQYKHMQYGEGVSFYFGYCRQSNIWTLTNSKDPCDDSWVAKSTETRTFDIRDFLSEPWVAKYESVEGIQTNGDINANGVQLSHFRLACLDNEESDSETLCEGLSCSCTNGGFGVFCQPIINSSACTSMTSSTGQDRFSDNKGNLLATDYKILVNESEPNNTVQVFYKPVFIGSRNEGSATLDIIGFAGRRWYILSTWLSKDQVIESCRRGFQVTVDKTFYDVQYISETVDDVNFRTITTPIGLQWYRPKRSGQYFVVDSTQPVDASLTCSLCNAISNTCAYDGVCQKNGKCDCKYGTTGPLCKITPIGDGICNDYFNKPDFNYDGGDCCGGSCLNPISGINCAGVLGTSAKLFGQRLTYAGRGFPRCNDPEMVPILIEIKPELNEIGIEVRLTCDNITYLNLPKEALQVDNYTNFGGTDIVKVQDGSACRLKVKVHDERLAEGAVQLNAMYKVYLKNESTRPLLLDEAIREASLDDNFSEFEKSFFVSSLLPTLSSYTSIEELNNSTTPQGQAIRWLSRDPHPHASIGSDFLVERYLVLVMNYAFDNLMNLAAEPDDSANDICRLRAIGIVTCSKDGSITSTEGFITTVDLSRMSRHGAIPTEIRLASNLEELLFSYNRLTGTLPTQLGELTNLVKLDLRNNELHGTIPSEIRTMEHLVNIDLGQNRLNGTIPNGMYHLGKLAKIDLSRNGFTGNISANVSMLQHIETIDLEKNKLTGSIPTSMGELTKLGEIDLEDNQFTGSIPSEFGRLTELSKLDLENSGVSGSIPSELGMIAGLKLAVFKHNDLTGTIPTELCSLTNLLLYVGCSNVKCPESCRTIICDDECSN